MRHAFILVAAWGLVVGASAVEARKTRTPRPKPVHIGRPVPNQMLAVTMPTKGTARAHPFINIAASLGPSNGLTPDLQTFRAHLGRADITKSFTMIPGPNGRIELRASIYPPLVHVGRRSVNRLRIVVRSTFNKANRPRRVRDVDKVRFRAVDVDDQPPEARLVVSTDGITTTPIGFDATKSGDPDNDPLTYHWDFGDGQTSDDPQPVHTYAGCSGDVTVTLRVEDPMHLASQAQQVLICRPECDAGRIPGSLDAIADQSLEFGSVPLGSSATRTFKLQNSDLTPNSQVKVNLGVRVPPWQRALSGLPDAGFQLSPTSLDLGPGEQADVTVTFTPTAPGHQATEVVLASCGSNADVVHVLARGFAGSAPNQGPTLAATPLFYLDFIRGPYGIMPNGTRFFADNSTFTCRDPNGNFTGDVCIVAADCPIAGSTCPTSSNCIAGDNAGRPCTTTADCPRGFCPSNNALDPIDFCGDGAGNLYLLSDEDSFTDPNVNAITEINETVLHVSFDANGNRTGVQVIDRTTSETQQITCEGTPGHRVYLAESFSVDPADQCFRDAREQVTTLQGGGPNIQRIDAVEGLDPCNDDLDPAQDFEVARDGTALFAALDSGLFQIYPSPLLITPDIRDFFQVHPDGSVLFASANDSGTTGVISLYKISPDQAIHGAPLLADLAPCTQFQLPNNGGRTLIFNSFAADRAAPGSSDAVVMVSFATTGTGGGGGAKAVLPSPLLVRGTVAFSSPGGTAPCSVLGLINLEFLDTITF